ncbi:MAG: JAB domain-containing protein [Deltaproteobacteria bacterium]|nr:JAB domain-containing protein [Deltaproteobacteria bacterium]
MKPYTVIYKLKTFYVRDSRPSRPSKNTEEPAKLTTPAEVAQLARAIFKTLDADKEHFVVLCLNQRNRLNGYKHVSTGSLTASLVHPREVFTAALELRAAAVVFVHNHPSGDPAPSADDVEITRRLREAGELLGFRVLDHIILGRDRHYSFQDADEREALKRELGILPRSKKSSRPRNRRQKQTRK